jgi:hypothetical protein
MQGKFNVKEVNSMANEEQLTLLMQGVEPWNKWREENFEADIDIDLSGAYLAKANLRSANLNCVDLDSADLSSVDLRGVDLSSAGLRGANLRAADLFFANLFRANLNNANLNRVNLSGASLINANLINAILIHATIVQAPLNKANFSKAIIDHTTFDDVDLSVANGLDAIRHLGPSTIGIDTICRSKGKIPEVFLRGCGVPDNFITFMHSLTQDTIQYYSCFISYTSKDQDCAEHIHNDLQAAGVRCWFAPEDLKIGDRFQDRIEESIRIYDKLLLILSDNSVSSPWVEREVQAGFERENKQQRTMLFPITLDDTVMESTKAWAADIRRTRHIGDFRNWKDHDSYQKAFARLLRDLKASEKEG